MRLGILNSVCPICPNNVTISTTCRDLHTPAVLQLTSSVFIIITLHPLIELIFRLNTDTHLWSKGEGILLQHAGSYGFQMLVVLK